LRCGAGNVEHGAASQALPHAETHTVSLPHVLAYNAAAAPDAMRWLERAMNAQNAAHAIFSLMQKLGALTSLEEIAGPHTHL
jgi:alcohol dehydrogenase class IV